MSPEEAAAYVGAIRTVCVNTGLGWVLDEVDASLDEDDSVEPRPRPIETRRDDFQRLRQLLDALEIAVVGRAFIEKAVLTNFRTDSVAFKQPRSEARDDLSVVDARSHVLRDDPDSRAARGHVIEEITNAVSNIRRLLDER